MTRKINTEVIDTKMISKQDLVYHLVVYINSDQVCHESIIMFHAFAMSCTIVLQLLHTLPVKPVYTFFIIVFNVPYILLAPQRHVLS